MKWISVKDKLPKEDAIIVAITDAEIECTGDAIEDYDIVLLRHWAGNEWRTLDSTSPYFFPDSEYGFEGIGCIAYWVPWQEFPFPNQPERSKREEAQECAMRCSEHGR
jgi:hypothetical protein